MADFVQQMTCVILNRGDMGGIVTETRSTVVFIGSSIMDWIWGQNKDNMSMELLKVVSQILELHFFILSPFSQDLDSPYVPRFDITQVIYRSTFKTIIITIMKFLEFNGRVVQSSYFLQLVTVIIVSLDRAIRITSNVFWQGTTKSALNRVRWFLRGA